MFAELVNSILYCYGVYQEFFDSICENISCPIQFYQGLPSMKDIDRIHNGQFHIIVLDDMMEHIVKNEDMAELFTMHCHHAECNSNYGISKPIFKRKTFTYNFFKHAHSCFIWK